MQEAYRPIEDIPAEKGLPTLEEYASAEENGLLKTEWYMICRRAHLTTPQWRAFKWYHIYGCTLGMTAGFMGVEEGTVRSHLEAAYSRLKRVPNQGLLTVLIEIFGLTDVMEAMETR